MNSVQYFVSVLFLHNRIILKPGASGNANNYVIALLWSTVFMVCCTSKRSEAVGAYGRKQNNISYDETFLF